MLTTKNKNIQLKYWFSSWIGALIAKSTLILSKYWPVTCFSSGGMARRHCSYPPTTWSAIYLPHLTTDYYVMISLITYGVIYFNCNIFVPRFANVTRSWLGLQKLSAIRMGFFWSLSVANIMVKIKKNV